MKQGKLIPYIIIGGFIAFASFIGSFVYKAMKKPVNLVKKDYYENGIQYEQQIKKIERSKKYKNDFKIAINGKQLEIDVPKDLIGFQSEVHLFRPSDKSLDQKIALRLDASKMKINISGIKTGFWDVKINLEKGDLTYYFEQQIEKK